MSELSESLLPALWRASWQGGIVIAILWCLCHALGRYLWFTADIRCWLWRAASVKLLISLAVSGSVILPVLPAAEPSKLPLSAALQTVPADTFVPAIAPNTVSPPIKEAKHPVFPWQTADAILYLAGVGVCLSRIILAGLQTRQLLRQASLSRCADAEAEIADFARRFGLRSTPRLRMSAGVTIPVYATGTVLLPAAATYTSEERRLVLAHELAHARRRDLAWEWLGTLTQALFFFHPFVIFARREEKLARESAADALALRITQSSPASYGKMLLSLSLVVPQSTPTFAGAGVVGAMESGKLLRRRLIALKEVNSMSLSGKQLILILGSSFAVAGVVLVPWRITQAAQPDSSVPGKSSEPSSTNSGAVTTTSPFLSAEKTRSGKVGSGNKRVLRELEAEYRALFQVLRGTDDQKVLSWYQNQTTPDFVLTKPKGRYSQGGNQSKAELISEIKTHTRRPLPAINTFFVNNVATVPNDPEHVTADCFVKVIVSEKDSKGRVVTRAVPTMVIIDLQRDVWAKVQGDWKLQSSKMFQGVKILLRGKPAVKVGNRYRS